MPKNQPPLSLDSLISSETNGATTQESPSPLPTHRVDPVFDEVDASRESPDSESETDARVKTDAPKASVPPIRQAHGASFMTGPVSSVSQLIGRKSVSKGTMGAFGSMDDYKDHIAGLTLGELHAHAVESHVVPIYDRPVLMARLEREYTAVAARLTPGKGPGQSRAQAGYGAEQNAKAQALLKKMRR